MKILINGKDYTGFTYAEVSRRFNDLSGKFTFKTNIVPQDSPDALSVQDSCQILVEDQPFLTGFLEKKTVRDSVSSSSTIYNGRDYTSSIIKSTCNSFFFNQFDNNTDISTLCKQAVRDLGLNDFIGSVKTLVTLPKLDITNFVNFFAGERVIDYLIRYAQFSKVILTTDGLSNIIIDRSAGAKINERYLPIQLINGYDNDINNVYDISYTDDITNQYREYYCYNQIGWATLNSGDANVIIKRNTQNAASIVDESVRIPSTWTFLDDVGGYLQNQTDRCTWEKNLRAAQRQIYSCYFVGHSYQDGSIWEPNKLVVVKDEKVGLSVPMLIEEVRFIESVQSGKVTHLRLVNPICYTIEAERDFYNVFNYGRIF